MGSRYFLSASACFHHLCVVAHQDDTVSTRCEGEKWVELARQEGEKKVELARRSWEERSEKAMMETEQLREAERQHAGQKEDLVTLLEENRHETEKLKIHK